MHRWLFVLAVLLLSSVASAQECAEPSMCVPEKDMRVFATLLREKQCQLDEKPTFELDPIRIVVDRDGRVFFTGNAPEPYTLRMTWCNYEVKAEGEVHVIAAMHKPPIWGFRFRPKAYMGLLPLEALYGDSQEFRDVTDAGFMADFLYYDWVNLNAALGYRSIGGGVGIDLTENFGAYSGYGLTWGSWHHNWNFSLTFSFWNP